MPDRYAVIGNPVDHSKSPQIHAEFARETGQDMVYGAIPAPVEAFEVEVRRFGKSGGRGLNVTLPFKHRAYGLATRRTSRAEQAQAANTLVFQGADVVGDNTDGVGLVRDLTANLQRALRSRRILLMGAGGASWGVCGPLLDRAPAALVIANRSMDKADALAGHFRACHANGRVVSTAGYGELSGKRFDLVINATSAGLEGTMPELPEDLFARDALAYEMLYGRTTPFMAFAAAHGALVADGVGMLVEQAAESFHVWRGVRPETAPVIRLLRQT